MALFSEGDLLGLAGVYGYVFSVIILSWSLRNRISNARKLVHVLTGGIVFFWWLFDSRWVMAGLAAFPFVPLLILATPKSPVAALREGPLGMTSSLGHPYGLVLYAVSWTLIAFFLFDDLFAASIAIAVMSFGDGMACVVGERFGRLRYSPDKTLEGSLAMLAAAVASILVLAWFYFDVIDYSGSTAPYFLLPFALAIAGLATLFEAFLPGSVDNLVVPLVIATLLHSLGV